MAPYSRNFGTCSSSSEAANSLSHKFGHGFQLESAVSMDMDQLAWQQLERVNALHNPARVQIQRPDMLGSVDCGYGQVLECKSARTYNEPLPESLPEEVFSNLDHRVEAPRKTRTGRRRQASETATPENCKNLISERRRRAKLKKSLITLRELVPMINMKMDRVSILTDAIDHLQDLKRQVEKLERPESNDDHVPKSSCADSLGTSEGEDQKNSSTDDSLCSEFFDDSVIRCDYETSPLSLGLDLPLIELDVTKLDHGMYKLDLICMEQSGILVQLSQAVEAFVIEIVHTSIVVISSTKVTCTFIVKMSSWNHMTLEDVKADVKKLLAKSGLQFSQVHISI